LQEGNYDKTYYLEPGEGGAKAYALLRRAMEMTGRIAIARVVIRSKESLAAIRVFQNGVLALETMHFPDEVRSPAGLTGITEPELRQQEIEMATNLVASLAGDFTPEKFQNEYRQALLELVDAKVTGDEVTHVAVAPERGRVVDLMEALRASIRQAEEGRGAEPGVAPGQARQRHPARSAAAVATSPACRAGRTFEQAVAVMERLTRSLSPLVEEIRKEYGPMQYLAVVELTTGRRTPGHRPHLHVLVRGPAVPKRWLSERWRFHTKGSFKVDYQRLRSPEHAGAYLVGYTVARRKEAQRAYLHNWPGPRIRYSRAFFPRPVAEIRALLWPPTEPGMWEYVGPIPWHVQLTWVLPTELMQPLPHMVLTG
jgi:hypothetical protein